MDSAAVLQSLLAATRGTGSSGVAASFACAASQLQLLGAAALRHATPAGLAEELLEKAEQLVGSKQATSRLLGLQLLGSTLANCHRRIFLQQHAQWAALLLATLRSEQQRTQKSRGGQPTAAAAEACACLAAYFARVGRMLEVPGLRRDGAAAASKLAALLLQQPGQAQQQADAQAAPPLLVLPQGQQALLAALTTLPSSFRQQHKQLKAALLPLLMQPARGGSHLLAACAAALPRIVGDGTSWSAFCQRLLASAHHLLDAALLQLDDASLAAAAKSACEPTADPLPLLPASPTSGALPSDAFTAAFGQLHAVLQTLQAMLGGSYPATVPLPVGGLLLLISRVASVGDSPSGGRAAAAAASSRFPQLCLQLPALQAAALRLLQHLLAAAGTAAAPYFVAAARLLSDVLRRAGAGGGALGTSPLVRCQLFATARQLMVAAGVGATRHLAPALLQAAAAELYGRQAAATEAGDGGEGPARKKARRGRQAAGADLAGDAAAGAPLDDMGAAGQLRDQAVQAAALEALEALCATGAPLLTTQQRRQLDDTAAHAVATAAAAVAQLSADAEAAVGTALAALQGAAYRLLLASLLAPAPHRPRHLAAALRLFRAGSGGGPQAAFCRNALLSCEALLHPRALPPPAPVRCVMPAVLGRGEEDGEAPPLGMPRFWSSVDAALLLQQEQVALQQQQAAVPRQQPCTVENVPLLAAAGEEGDIEMDAVAPLPPAAAQAAAAAAVPRLQAAQPAVQPRAKVSRMAAMLAAPANAPVASLATLPVPEAATALPPALAPAPAAPVAAFAAAAAPLPAAAPMAVTAAATAAAAAESEDSEGSLPEIDSGEGSSGSDSDEAASG